MKKSIKNSIMGIVLFNIAYNEKHNKDSDIYINTYPDIFSVARVAKITWPIMKWYLKEEGYAN